MMKPSTLVLATALSLPLIAGPAFADPGCRKDMKEARDAAFDAADADGNDALTRDEFEDFHDRLRQSMADARFEKLDADDDDLVTLEELEDGASRRRLRRRERGPRF